MCCKFDKAPPILRNEEWRSLGDVKSLNFSVIFRGRLSEKYLIDNQLRGPDSSNTLKKADETNLK